MSVYRLFSIPFRPQEGWAVTFSLLFFLWTDCGGSRSQPTTRFSLSLIALITFEGPPMDAGCWWRPVVLLAYLAAAAAAAELITSSRYSITFRDSSLSAVVPPRQEHGPRRIILDSNRLFFSANTRTTTTTLPLTAKDWTADWTRIITTKAPLNGKESHGLIEIDPRLCTSLHRPLSICKEE